MEQLFDRSLFIFSRFAAAINAAGGRHQYRLWICVGLQSPILQPSSAAWIEVRQWCGAILELYSVRMQNSIKSHFPSLVLSSFFVNVQKLFSTSFKTCLTACQLAHSSMVAFCASTVESAQCGAWIRFFRLDQLYLS